VLTDADSRLRATGIIRGADPGRSALRPEQPNLMETIGPNSALVLWQQERLSGFSGEDQWPRLRQLLNATAFEDACRAAMSGPIRFEFLPTDGSNMVLRHLSILRGLTQIFGLRAVLDLHDGNRDSAWTNVLASTRLITAWETEPAEISHLVRCSCVAMAYSSMWQLLQARGWRDAQLASLQREWESINFFRSLPETAAFTRICLAAACQLERQESLPSLALALKATRRSSQSAWDAFTDHVHRIRYHYHGIYEDEKDMLLFYRDREIQLRNAARLTTWAEMRQLPGITNTLPFQPKYPSRVQVMLNTRQIGSGFPRSGEGLPGRVAGAESRRRVIVTALALERYQSQHGSYPQSLQNLVPEFLKEAPTDFMDGQPLRYQLTDNHHFILYSVGLDCIDNGGETPRTRRGRDPYGSLAGMGIPEGTDLVWPRPASEAEIQAYQDQEDQTAVSRTTARPSH
jgi:hypothetical protein